MGLKTLPSEKFTETDTLTSETESLKDQEGRRKSERIVAPLLEFEKFCPDMERQNRVGNSEKLASG